jgi:subtilisin-like proprotein convertase family protein
VFSQDGGDVLPGFDLTISNPGGLGVVYVTTDGSDPRGVGGSVGATASEYVGPVDVSVTTTVTARVLDGSVWSAATSAVFVVDSLPPFWAGSGSFATDVAVVIVDEATVTSPLVVSGVGTVADVDVSFSATHTYDGDVDVFLISPSGTRVELFTDIGGATQDFVGTTLDDEAATSITAGVAPYTGRFRPEGALSVLDGEDPNGTWVLEITDDGPGDVGVLSGWSLDFGVGAGGVVSASGVTDTTVDLAWSGAGDDVGVVDYNVYQDGVVVQTGVVGTSTTVTGLSADTAYTFTIQARDAALNVSTDGPSVVASTT